VTRRELERLLDLLGKLSEEGTLSGARKDEIGSIRSECWRLLDEKEG